MLAISIATVLAGIATVYTIITSSFIATKTHD